MSITSIFEEIVTERKRQEYLKSIGKFSFTCRDDLVAHEKKLSVLVEEVGEVSKDINGYTSTVDKYIKKSMLLPTHRAIYFLGKIRTELIQVATVCVAWIESIDYAIECLK